MPLLITVHIVGLNKRLKRWEWFYAIGAKSVAAYGHRIVIEYVII